MATYVIHQRAVVQVKASTRARSQRRHLLNPLKLIIKSLRLIQILKSYRCGTTITGFDVSLFTVNVPAIENNHGKVPAKQHQILPLAIIETFF